VVDEAHSSDFDNTLDCEDEREEMSRFLDKFVSWKQVISIVILVASHEDGIDENHQNNKIVKHWPANQLNCFVTETVALVKTAERILVKYHKLTPLFEFVSSASKYFLLWAHCIFTNKFHLFVLGFGSLLFVTCLSEELHVLS